MLEILQNIGIAGAIVTGSAWLIRRLSEQFFAKNLEKFKSGLEKEAIRFKIQYESLHAERAEVIKEVYKLIVRTHKSFQSLMSPLQLAGELPEEEKSRIAADNANELTDYYEENRIFFEEDLAEEIDELLQSFRDAWNKFKYSREARSAGRPDIDEWGEAWDKISKETPPIKKQIENRFRGILGIENHNDQNQTKD